MSSTNRNSGINLTLSKSDMRSLIAGLDRIKDKFTARGANTKINRIVYRASKPMRKAAKALAPVGETGNLKKSAGGWMTKSGVRAGANYKGKGRKGGWYVHLASYPHKVRGGGMTEKSTPFLADAFNNTQGVVGKLIIEGVKKELKW
tara:strand:+ start:1387 stop:1827 length:441 start_codon:yes stop_codon:yes gene_type:complete